METFFNPPKVDIICMFTAAFSQLASIRLDSLACTTDATIDIEQTENKCVKSANYHFNKFVLASTSLCSLIISVERNMALVFKESSFQIFLTRLLAHAHFYFKCFYMITLSGIRLFNLNL